ncbi:unnamed protein product [Meloidogyne enterolobii]|uniref:Uncharacterized protein n=2 Tax=Meloidogyne enterolobii TaxID=390850 RepID=A0A6V7XS59_MELEN|nr:unnamed protein product [Meloidogyne enterolobii]
MSHSNFDKLDSLAENSKDWTLQNDIDLKNILEEYSNNLIKSSEGLNEGIKKLNENMEKIDVRLGNVFNNLNYLKMTRLVEEVDDISLDTLVQKNKQNVNEKKNLTKEEFEQQTIQTISSSIIKAFQKISETNIPITEGFSTSDPLDPCSSSQINSDFNKEIENPFVKMCKFPPIIGSKESFNYSRRGVVLKENTQSITTSVEKSSIQKVTLKDEDIQSTSSGRSIPPQDPTAGFNQTKTLLDQMVAKMAEKNRAMGIEQGNSEHSSLSQGLSLENSGKTTSPSFSSTSYETSTSSRPAEKIQKPENAHFIKEKTSEKSSIHSSKQSTNFIKNPISAKERDEELFSSTESDDYGDNTSIFSSNTKKSVTSGISNEQQKVPSNIVTIPKDDQNNVVIQHSLKTKEMEKTSKPSNNRLNSFKQNQQLTEQSFTSSIQNDKKESKTDEFSSVSVKGLIAQIGNKIPIGRPDEKNTKETNQKEKEEKTEQEENAEISNEHLNILKGRVKGPASRRAPSHLNIKLQKNNSDENAKLNEAFNKSKENEIKELENKKEGHKTIKETEGLEKEVVKPIEVTKVLKEDIKIIKENSKEVPKQLKEQPKQLLENTHQKSTAIFNNPKPIKKGLSIFSSSSDDDFDLNINKKIVKEKVVEQPKQFKQKIENIGEIKQQNVEKLKSKQDVPKQRKGLFDDSDSDF